LVHAKNIWKTSFPLACKLEKPFFFFKLIAEFKRIIPCGIPDFQDVGKLVVLPLFLKNSTKTKGKIQKP
jgi:hypothetical protein